MSWGQWGGRRMRGGWGGGGYGGYGGGPWGRGPYGGGPYGRGGGGGCLRDMLLMETGCCLAEALGCGPQLLFVAPSLLRARPRPGEGGTCEGDTWALRLVHAYQTRISPRRAQPCCRLEPTCSAYALTALERHGTWSGMLLTARRLLRCRPGGPRGYDPVP